MSHSSVSYASIHTYVCSQAVTDWQGHTLVPHSCHAYDDELMFSLQPHAATGSQSKPPPNSRYSRYERLPVAYLFSQLEFHGNQRQFVHASDRNQMAACSRTIMHTMAKLSGSMISPVLAGISRDGDMTILRDRDIRSPFDSFIITGGPQPG